MMTNHIDTNNHASSKVYAYISRILRNRGCTRSQFSCWRIENQSAANAALDAGYVAAQMEARFGQGIFLHLDYERRTHFFHIR